MSDDMGQQKLHELKQRRETRVTGGQESSAPRIERVQEGQDAEVTATCAKRHGEYSEVTPVGTSRRMEDVVVSVTCGAEKVRTGHV